MRTSHCVQLVRPPGSAWEAEDFRAVPHQLPDLATGELLVHNTWLSVDASVALRLTGGAGGYFPHVELDVPVEGWAVGRVVESRSDRFPLGGRVLHHRGWRDVAVLDGRETGWGGPMLLPDDGLPDETYLGILGPTGLTAWAGLLRVGRPAPGDVVYVSAAAGAVGCLVLQLAVARGHRVIASAGSPAKLDLLRRWGAAEVFNYRSAPVSQQLARAAPDGIDLYFDNVGGDHLEAALTALRPGGRAVLCGAISTYADGARPPTGPRNLFEATVKGLTLQGFLARMYAAELEQCQTELRAELLAGRLQLPVHVVKGLEEASRGLADLVAGTSTGKVLVRLQEQHNHT